MILRPYQVEACDAVMREWATVRSTLVVIPTGGGKTVCFAELIRRLGGSALVLAHRSELIWQAADKIHAVTGFRPEIEMAEHRARGSVFANGIVVSSVQTQLAGRTPRMERFDPREFRCVIVDECHHAPAAGFRHVLKHYLDGNPDLRVLGVTATPDRTDELALGEIFETVAYRYGIDDAIDDGWLVPVRQQPIHIRGLDWSGVRVTAGDLNAGDLERAMVAEQVPQQIANATLDETGDRKFILFVPTVAVAAAVQEIMERRRPGATAVISGATPKDERRGILARFARRELTGLVNCMVLTEGFDDVGVECCVLGRPTKSRLLFAQMVGRVLRPLSGVVDGPESAADRRAAIAASAKPHAEVIDLRGNCGRHRLVTCADILGGEPLPELRERAREVLDREGRSVDVGEAYAIARGELAEEERERRAAAERREAELEAERARRRHLVAKAVYERGGPIDPFDVLGIDRTPEFGGDAGEPLTEKQVAILERAGIETQGLKPNDGRRLVGEVIRRWKSGGCTYGQARILARAKLPTDVSKGEANRLIDELFARRRAARTVPPLPAGVSAGSY